MPSDRQTEIQARVEKATPGPWAWESIAEKSNEFAVGQAYDAGGNPLHGRLPADEWVEDTIIERRGLVGMNESGHASFADAEFIAHAREDIPWLLAELSRVQQERDEALKERDDASRALDELVAPDPDKPLARRIRDEFADFQMAIRHCSEIYDDVSGGLVSKPDTLPSVVKALADDRTTALVEEEVREQTAELRAERDALQQEIATLRQQIGDVAERLDGLQEGDSRTPDWYHAASIAEEWVRALLQKGQ